MRCIALIFLTACANVETDVVESYPVRAPADAPTVCRSEPPERPDEERQVTVRCGGRSGVFSAGDLAPGSHLRLRVQAENCKDPLVLTFPRELDVRIPNHGYVERVTLNFRSVLEVTIPHMPQGGVDLAIPNASCETTLIHGKARSGIPFQPAN